MQVKYKEIWRKYLEQHPWQQPEGYDTGIRLHNSLTREKDPLILPKGKVVSWSVRQYGFSFYAVVYVSLLRWRNPPPHPWHVRTDPSVQADPPPT